MTENNTLENFSHIKMQVETHIKSPIRTSESLGGGFNNSIFKIETENNQIFTLKWYFKDDRDRLKREFSSFEYLRSIGENRLPTPFYKDDEIGYALYSFEEGSVRTGSELSYKDLDQFLSFIGRLQALQPESVIKKFDNAVLSTRSIEQRHSSIMLKTQKFIDFASTNKVDSQVLEFIDDRQVLQKMSSGMQKIKDASNGDFSTEIDPSLVRLSPVDFGPHNALFKKHGEICFLDFEYFGWDDPIKIVANFVTHEGTFGLPKDKISYFIEKYQKQSTFSKKMLNRLNLFVPLETFNWIGIFLWSLTPEKMNSRKFSNPNFDEKKYTQYLIDRIGARLDQLDNFI